MDIMQKMDQLYVYLDPHPPQWQAFQNSTVSSSLACLCPDKNGFAPFYEDMTLRPCFVTGIISNIPNVFALLFVSWQLIAFNRNSKKYAVPLGVRQSVLLGLTFLLFFLGVWDLRILQTANQIDIYVLTACIRLVGLLVVLYMAFIERTSTYLPSGTLLVFYALDTLANLVAFFSLSTSSNSHLAAFLASFAAFLLHSWPRDLNDYRPYLDQRRLNPYDQANLLSRVMFSWMTPMMRKGHEKYLTQHDLPELASSDHTDACAKVFEKHWAYEVQQQRHSLLRAIVKAYGLRYLVGAVCKFLQDSLSFVQPLFLRMLIRFVQDYADKVNIPEEKPSLAKGFYIALAMFVCSVMQTAFLHQYFERSFGVGMSVRTALTNAIYRKSLRISTETLNAGSIGATVNLMSIDTQRLQDFCPNGNILWSSPFQIILCLTELYYLLGPSMWAGVTAVLILIPINSRLAAYQKVLQQEQMVAKDNRTRITSEIVSSIKSIKLYAWERAFIQRLSHARNTVEIGILRKTGIFLSFMLFLWSTAPFMVSCSTFAFYIFASGRPFTSDVVFPALSLFSLLQFPMSMLPHLISGLIEATVAKKRITEFLMADEIEKDLVERLPAQQTPNAEALSIKNGTFSWGAHTTPVLHDIEYTANKGELSCIVGKVASGKSSLLMSILGDIRKVNGKVTVKGSVAYVAQNPWIFSGTVKENILFGLEYDEEIYKETITACALDSDLESLPDGDATFVGEKGISLSGGQKARLSLARAVYARVDVYLLDDPLSAVDEHVGRHIIENVLGPEGLLSSKAVVLATNSVTVLSHAHSIVMLSEGRIVDHGSFADIMRGTSLISKLINEFGGHNGTPEPSSESEASSKPDDSPEQFVDFGVNKAPGLHKRRQSLRRPGPGEWRVEAPVDSRQEHMERGKVSWGVYLEYFRTCGTVGIIILFILVLIVNGLSVASNVYLKYWAELENDKNQGLHLFIFALLGFSSSIFSVVQSLVLFLGCSLRASRFLHDGMFDAVMKAPMSFFETTPIGRIVNRFSNDVYKVDSLLARTFQMLLNSSARVMYSFAVIAFGTPGILFILVPLMTIYFYYQRYYLRTSRELKRLESVSKSPVYAQFQETLDGLYTIRAFGHQARFNYINEANLDHNNQAYFLSISANRWLAVRLEFIGSVIILSSAMLSVRLLPSGRIGPGMIGLALSYALSITQTLNWIVRMTVEVETNIVSVERMLEYTELTPEAPHIIEDKRPLPEWPNHGQVIFDQFSCRYRPDLPLVLKNIVLNIQPGEKIGIVGRTGAGKSSLTLALFRLIEADSGYIEIDGQNTSEIGLEDLRSNLSIIPQDAQLFQDTVRGNLDPCGVHDDLNIWNVLEMSHLKNHVQNNMDGGLDARIAENGANLSAGQKQLFCLARAMLSRSKVLVLDEATAAVDVETDTTLQLAIRKEFKDRTILTIAHRLNTIMDSDRVLVLENGEVCEFDTPETLLNQTESKFYSLCKKGKLVE